MSIHREIWPGIHWIQECGPDRAEMGASALARGETWYAEGREIHIPQNAYLFLGERTLLFDTLSPQGGETIERALDELLGERRLDFLAVSHPDVPHAGNTARILRARPEARLVAPREGDTHELYQLGGALKLGPGDEIDLGGLLLRFHEATFLDAALHTWITEETSRTLFPVDWLGFPHLDGECLKFADEVEALDLGDPATAADQLGRLTEFHARVMFWFQYVDVDRVHAEIDRLARTFEGYRLAPAHGLVIREGQERYFEMMKEVVARVAESGRVGVL